MPSIDIPGSKVVPGLLNNLVLDKERNGLILESANEGITTFEHFCIPAGSGAWAHK